MAGRIAWERREATLVLARSPLNYPEGQTNQPTNLARKLLVPVSPLLSTEELIIFSFDFSLVQCYFGTCAIFRAS